MPLLLITLDSLLSLDLVIWAFPVAFLVHHIEEIFTIALAAFLLHVIGHIAFPLVFSRYTPGLITAVLIVFLIRSMHPTAFSPPTWPAPIP